MLFSSCTEQVKSQTMVSLKYIGGYLREAVSAKSLAYRPKMLSDGLFRSWVGGIQGSAKLTASKTFLSISHRKLVITPRWGGIQRARTSLG